MPYPLSNDLRLRVVGYVEAGHSCHEAARQFRTSVSFAVNLMRLFRETGSVEPKPRGGLRHSKLNQHRVFILRQVERQDDITMPELAQVLAQAKGTEVASATLSRWLIANGLSFKKNPAGIRTRQA